MAYVTVREGSVSASVPEAQVVSKEMEVFYNPVMKLNRDLSVLLLKTIGEQRRKEDPSFSFTIGSPLAGSGIREARFLVELKGMVKEIGINDYSPDAVALIKKNLAKNKVAKPKGVALTVSCDEANKFLLDSCGYGYIDIDPFGTPNPFLDAAIKRLQRNGILAVTATDTSALAGTYPDACGRKYWATPMRNYLMHEVGLRILVRKIQLIGAQYEKALLPVYSYSKDHYVRVFFVNERQKKSTDALLRQHQYFVLNRRTFAVTARATNLAKKDELIAGPLWTGQLFDKKLAAAMVKMNKEWTFGQPANQKFLELIAAEAEAPTKLLGFYMLNLVRTTGKMPLRKEKLLGRKGVYPTHLESNAVRATSLKLLF